MTWRWPGSARSTGRDPLGHLLRQVPERAPEDLADEGERGEAFIVRMALDDEGRPVRTRVTHARTAAEHVWPGWAPDEVVGFVEDCAVLWSPRPPVDGGVEPAPDPVPEADPEDPGVHEHVVDVDTGRILGRPPRDLVLRLAVAAELRTPTVLVELCSRGDVPEESSWTVRATRRADVGPAGEVALPFTDLALPRGLHRLRLRVTVRPATPSRVPPAITLLRSPRQL